MYVRHPNCVKLHLAGDIKIQKYNFLKFIFRDCINQLGTLDDFFGYFLLTEWTLDKQKFKYFANSD